MFKALTKIMACVGAERTAGTYANTRPNLEAKPSMVGWALFLQKILNGVRLSVIGSSPHQNPPIGMSASSLLLAALIFVWLRNFMRLS